MGAEFLNGFRQYVGRHQWWSANGQSVAGFGCRSPDPRNGTIHFFQTLPYNAKQFNAVTCQPDVSRRAIKQAESKLGFQLSYQNTEARRRDVECFRGAREASMLRNQQKSPELSGRKIH